jgi:multiple sugar transport system ATP-binding protein
VLQSRPGLARFEEKPVILGVRPEEIEDASLAGDGERVSAVVDIREDMGSEVYVHFSVGGKPVRGEHVTAAVGQDAADVAETAGNVWVARLDRDTHAAEGKQVELAVDTARLHFFDPETGEGIYRKE